MCVPGLRQLFLQILENVVCVYVTESKCKPIPYVIFGKSASIKFHGKKALIPRRSIRHQIVIIFYSSNFPMNLSSVMSYKLLSGGPHH